MSFQTKERVLSSTTVSSSDESRVDSELPSKLQDLESRRANHSIKMLLHSVRLLYTMLRDRDFTLSLRAKAISIAALLYFIAPIDAIPDYIPFLGYVDDGAVLTAVLKMLVSEIDAYRLFTVSRSAQ